VTFHRLLCGFLLLAIAGAAQAAEFSAKVIAVLDGDTLLVLRGGSRIKVRLADIDAPEKDQPHGMVSRETLIELAAKRRVQVASRATDDYNRLIATVHADGVNLNREQVRLGMAWAAPSWRGRKADETMVALQEEARREKRGLWAAPGAIEPWRWRRSSDDHGGRRHPAR